MTKLKYIILGVIAEGTIRADYIYEMQLRETVHAGSDVYTTSTAVDNALEDLFKRKLIEYMPGTTDRYRLKLSHL